MTWGRKGGSDPQCSCDTMTSSSAVVAAGFTLHCFPAALQHESAGDHLRVLIKKCAARVWLSALHSPPLWLRVAGVLGAFKRWLPSVSLAGACQRRRHGGNSGDAGKPGSAGGAHATQAASNSDHGPRPAHVYGAGRHSRGLAARLRLRMHHGSPPNGLQRQTHPPALPCLLTRAVDHLG